MTNTDMSLSSESSLFLQHIPLVYQQILEVLKGYLFGFRISYLPWLEEGLGVKGIEKLVDEMVNKGLLLYFKGRESKEKSVTSARMVEFKRKFYLKNDVKNLLNRHGGEIAFESFEDLYKHQFNLDFNYDYYALTDLDHLCQVFKDILVVEVANPSGAKVIKAAVKIYNLRKRKRNE